MSHNTRPVSEVTATQELEALLRIHEETRLQILIRLAAMPADENGQSWLTRLEQVERTIVSISKPNL